MAEHNLGIRLESWRISPACQRRGRDVAWEDAISRLKQVYDVQLERFEGKPITLSVAIHLQEGDHHELPSQPHSKPQGQGGCPEKIRCGACPRGAMVLSSERVYECNVCPARMSLETYQRSRQPQDQEGREKKALKQICDEADRICGHFPVGRSLVADFAAEIRSIARSALQDSGGGE